MPVVPFIGFAPDISEMTPGVITSCSLLVPSDRGMKGAPSVADLGFSALAAECVGAAYVRKLDGTLRVLAGTSSQLYELSGTSWTSRFSSAAVARWSIAQFGDITIASNDVDNILQSTSGSFTAVTNAPKARIVIAVPNFVVAFNTQNGSASSSFGDSPDRWWCSAYQNAADWAINAANQCVSERLIGGGEFTAAAPFGTGWVAYKEREMFHAFYTGGDEVFTVQRVAGDQGCIAPGAVADMGGGSHCFVGSNDIYIYDGSRAYSIAAGKVQNWFFSQLSRTYAALTRVIYERARERVWIFYVPDGFTPLVRALVFHVPSGRWGRYDIESGMYAPLMYPSATGSGDVPAYFNTSQSLGTISGSSVYVGPTLGTGWYGSDDQESYVGRVQLLSDSAPSGATVSPKTRPRSGKATTTLATATADATGNFDIRQTAHWHRFDFAINSDAEVSGMTLHSVPAGRGR